MRILADENMFGSVVRALRDTGHDVLFIREVTPGISDDEVLSLALQQDRLLLTSDKEFASRASQAKHAGLAGIVLLRFGGIGLETTARLVTEAINSRSDWRGHIAVLEPHSSRMRRL